MGTSVTTSAPGSQDLDLSEVASTDLDSLHGESAGSKQAVHTTLKLTGFPTSFTRSLLVELLDSEGLEGEYNFAYLPANFKCNGSCYGYAFVNFVTGGSATVARRCLETTASLEVSWADSQGLDAQIERFRNSPIMHLSVVDEAKPALFCGGLRIAFPAPTERINHPRMRRTGRA